MSAPTEHECDYCGEMYEHPHKTTHHVCPECRKLGSSSPYLEVGVHGRSVSSTNSGSVGHKAGRHVGSTAHREASCPVCGRPAQALRVTCGRELCVKRLTSHQSKNPMPGGGALIPGTIKRMRGEAGEFRS
jgi:hypothetical protein